MTTPTLLQAAQAVVTIFKMYRSDMPLDVLSDVTNLEQAIEREKAKPQDVAEVINDLDAKMYASFAMSPKPVSGTSSGRHCGACKHDIHPMPSRCYKCGAGDLSNWEPKP